MVLSDGDPLLPVYPGVLSNPRLKLKGLGPLQTAHERHDRAEDVQPKGRDRCPQPWLSTAEASQTQSWCAESFAPARVPVDLATVLVLGMLVLVWVASYVASGFKLSVPQATAFWAAVLLQAALPFALVICRVWHRVSAQHAALVRLLLLAALLLLNRPGLPTLLLAPGPAAAPLTDSSACTALPYLAFVLKSALGSRALLLALAAFSSPLPFGRHLAIHSATLAATILGNYGVCSEVCAAHGPALAPHFKTMLSHLNLLAAPAFATTGLSSQADSALPMPSSPQFQCWLVWSFQAFLWGGLAPTLALLWLEVFKRQGQRQEQVAQSQRSAAQRRALSPSAARRATWQSCQLAPIPEEGSEALKGGQGAAEGRSGEEESSCLESSWLDTAGSNAIFLLVAGLSALWIGSVVGASVLEGLVLG